MNLELTPGRGKMSKGLESQLKSIDWFRKFDGSTQHSAAGVLLKALAGIVIGLMFYLGGHITFAVIVWVIGGIITAVSLGSERGRAGLARFFAVFGHWVGRLTGYVLLAPTYIIGFTFVHMLNMVSGSDPLQIKKRDRRTLWLECDRDERKVRHIRSMFATEVIFGRRRTALVVLLGGVFLFIAAELLLRFMGFGNPILYMQDPDVGYFPAPNQYVVRYGGRIMTNSFGMRAPDFTREKPEDTFRILLLGDSTLWGGSYIDQDDLYARRLERHLNENNSGRKVEVLNMGVNGWGPFHKIGYVKKFGTFDADIAIIALPIDDIYREHYGLENFPYMSLNFPPRMAIEEVVMHLLWRYRIGRLAPTAEIKEEYAKRGIEAYRRLTSMLKEAGCEVFVEILPSQDAGTTGTVPQEQKEKVEIMRRFLEADGFTTHYPAGLFMGAGEPDELYHDVCHLDREGHRVYAGYLNDRIHESNRFSLWKGKGGK